MFQTTGLQLSCTKLVEIGSSQSQAVEPNRMNVLNAVWKVKVQPAQQTKNWKMYYFFGKNKVIYSKYMYYIVFLALVHQYTVNLSG